MTSPGAPVEGLIRLSSGSLIVGGALVALLNLVLSPLLPSGFGTAAVVTSPAFALRMPIAATAVALVTLGAVGLYLAQAERLRWGRWAFLLAFIGGLTAFCVESVQFTLIRDLGFVAPEILDQLSDAGELVRYDLGFAIGAGLFVLGWLWVVVVTLRAGVLDRRGPIVLLSGVVLLPLLGALFGLWGAVAGNLVLGAGWMLIGLDLRRRVGSA